MFSRVRPGISVVTARQDLREVRETTPSRLIPPAGPRSGRTGTGKPASFGSEEINDPERTGYPAHLNPSGRDGGQHPPPGLAGSGQLARAAAEALTSIIAAPADCGTVGRSPRAIALSTVEAIRPHRREHVRRLVNRRTAPPAPRRPRLGARRGQPGGRSGIAGQRGPAGTPGHPRAVGPDRRVRPWPRPHVAPAPLTGIASASIQYPRGPSISPPRPMLESAAVGV